MNRILKDCSISTEFEKAIATGLYLIQRVAKVEKVDMKEQLKRQGTVNVVTIAMSAFPSNSDVIE